MRGKKPVILFIFLTFGLDVSAASTYQVNGTITEVDLENNTFSVVHTDIGATKTYSFPNRVNVIDNGIIRHDKSLVTPGLSVVMKFRRTGAGNTAGYRDEYRREMTMTGTVIKLDRSAGIGSLRQDRSNNIVPFRFTETFQKADMPRVGDKVVFTYSMDSAKIGMK